MRRGGNRDGAIFPRHDVVTQASASAAMLRYPASPYHEVRRRPHAWQPRLLTEQRMRESKSDRLL
jgi:hypothetical protein